MTSSRVQPRSARRIDHARTRDTGAILPMVLVMAVIGSLIVLPLLTYALTLYKQNDVLVDKTARVEAARGGLRAVLGDPIGLYDACGQGGLNTPVRLGDIGLDLSTTTDCYFIASATSNDPGTLRYGNATTKAGSSVPVETAGSAAPSSGSATPTDWQANSSPIVAQDTIWLPNLPVHALDPRSATPATMPPVAPATVSTCDVYFPGTYRDPLVLDSRAFFVSGVYYFENTVTVAGGADVVVGEGSEGGCTTDQVAVFSAANAPATHNSTGKGATFVFGADGRFIVDDTDGGGDRSIVFNQRYVFDNEVNVLSSKGVNFMSVNGDTTSPSGALSEPGVIDVPMSFVGEGTATLATDQGYLPSTVVALPDVPESPTNLAGIGYEEAVTLTWDIPANDGGGEITTYTVTANNGSTCTSTGFPSCTVVGLDLSTSYTFTVVATNSRGDSPASSASSAVQANGTLLEVPSRPRNIASVPYDGAVVVSWDYPGNDFGSPVTSFEVIDVSNTVLCSTDRADDTSCLITGLPNGVNADLRVTATNVVGTGLDRAVPPVIPNLGSGTPPADPAYVGSITPIIEIDLSSGSTSIVDVPGYISMPMGRLSLENPTGQTVKISGGLFGGELVGNDSRAGTAAYEVGFVNAIVQRTFKIVTTATEGPLTNVAVAIVQVNKSGGWAVNSWEVQ